MKQLSDFLQWSAICVSLALGLGQAWHDPEQDVAQVGGNREVRTVHQREPGELLEPHPLKALPSREIREARVIRVKDADTFVIEIWERMDLRLEDTDAWEMSTARRKSKKFQGFTPEDWVEEIEKGTLATQEVIDLIRGRPVKVEFKVPRERGIYKRMIGMLWVEQKPEEWVHLGQWLHYKGHLREPGRYVRKDF